MPHGIPVKRVNQVFEWNPVHLKYEFCFAETAFLPMILRSSAPPAPGKRVNLHIGSGRLGASFSAHGLMDAEADPNVTRVGQTVLMHGGHWHRGVFGIDQHVPLLRLHWDHAPETGQAGYSQRLDTDSGLLETVLGPSGPRIAATCHPGYPDIIGFALEGRRIRDVLVSPLRTWITCYGERIKAPPHAGWQGSAKRWRTTLRLGTAASDVSIHLEGNARAVSDKGRLRISFGRGPARIFLSIESPETPLKKANFPTGDFFESAARAWKMASPHPVIKTDDPRLQQLAKNSLHHLMCAYAPTEECPPPPMGWTGNAWGHHFPQDLSYIHPVFLMLGRYDIAKGIVGFYASRLAQMEEATQRIYRLPGTMWAWEFPIGTETRILPDGKAPNPFQYEIHNAAYPARMALETALATRDHDWARTSALPVILGSAQFYTAALRRGRDGRWGIRIKPSMGQDEFGGEDATDYLCALFAANFTLHAAVQICRLLRIRHPDVPKWKRILAEGLAFPRLLDKKSGVYATSRRRDWQLHRQKHPVQLSPYVFLPQPIDGPTRRAYQIRHALCANDRPGMRHPGTGGSFYDGWTLFAYALACAKAGDRSAMEEILAEIEISQLTDHEHIQIYESSGFWKPCYTTSMGLFLQALLNDTKSKSTRF